MSEFANRGYVHADVLVSTEWVARHLNDEDIRIVESNEDPLLYPSGHIPGAVQRKLRRINEKKRNSERHNSYFLRR